MHKWYVYEVVTRTWYVYEEITRSYVYQSIIQINGECSLFYFVIYEFSRSPAIFIAYIGYSKKILVQAQSKVRHLCKSRVYDPLYISMVEKQRG